jgi:hypothetical protein
MQKSKAAQVLRAIPSKLREQASRDNGKLGGRPPRFSKRELDTLRIALNLLDQETFDRTDEQSLELSASAQALRDKIIKALDN